MMLNRLLTIELGEMAAVAEDILHLQDSLICVALGTVLQLLCSSLLNAPGRPCCVKSNAHHPDFGVHKVVMCWKARQLCCTCSFQLC